MGKPTYDNKEITPCGGSVRYDTDSDDHISYSSFVDVAKCKKCVKCSWNTMCEENARPTTFTEDEAVEEVEDNPLNDYVFELQEIMEQINGLAEQATKIISSVLDEINKEEE